jgi:hypothetical protein
MNLFIAESRAVSRLTAPTRDRTDDLLQRACSILVGDANGADNAVQQHLADRQYTRVGTTSAPGPHETSTRRPDVKASPITPPKTWRWRARRDFHVLASQADSGESYKPSSLCDLTRTSSKLPASGFR